MRMLLGGCIAAMALSLGLFALSVDSDAQATRIRLKQQGEQRSLADQARIIAGRCQAELTASLDWSGFDISDLEHHSAARSCGAALEAMHAICRSDLGMATVRRRIRALVCRYGDRRAMTMTLDGTLTYTMNFHSANDAGFTRRWLLDNL